MTNPPPFEAQETAGLRAGGFSSGRSVCANRLWGSVGRLLFTIAGVTRYDPVAAVVMFAASKADWASVRWVQGTSRLAANLLRRGESPPECHQSTGLNALYEPWCYNAHTWQAW